MHAPGGGSGGPGQRAFFVGYVPAACGGPAADQGVGLHLQERCFRLVEEKPQVRGLVLRPGLLDAGQRGDLPAGNTGTPETAGGKRPSVYHFPHPGAQPQAGGGPRKDRGPHGRRAQGGAVRKTVPARLGRVGERGGKHHPGLLDKVSRGGRAGKE